MVTGTWSVAWLRVERRGSGWDDEEASFSLPRVIRLISASPTLTLVFWGVCVCVCVCVCVSVCTCVHARVREKEGALAPESALWGDHSCTLPAANWSLSSCPIHLHFLPITEHYLCSQLGMGLNPFWLSWCYSLQISNGDGEGCESGGGGGDRERGRKGGGAKVIAKNKFWNFPSSLTGRKQSINNDITRRREEKMEEINYWRYNSSPCLQTLQPHWLGCSCCTHCYWLVKTIFSHHQWFCVRGHTDNNALRGPPLIIQDVFILKHSESKSSCLLYKQYKYSTLLIQKVHQDAAIWGS